MTRPILVPEPDRPATLPPDAGLDALARAIWAHGHDRGVRAMEALAAMAVNARHRSPGRSLLSVARDPALFAAWDPADPRHGPMLAVEAGDAGFAAALRVARRAVAGPDRIVAGADRFLDEGAALPDWAASRTPVALLAGFSFYRT
ncbi:cell wall hydrolase [Niveispirillum sp. KHB5.9]|uniref:cell wall hydrolase n=1 Tax=Niveispirillum sp. KHB5.9 TaxID=3400269 RepID=UPI003A876E8A